MDARQRRTRQRLDEVILRLAAETPIDELAVADVAREAGISRDTFYRWAASPVDLLADTLLRLLDDLLAETPGARPGPLADGTASGTGSAPYDLDPLTDAILGFIAEHADIYRLASRPRMNSTLRDGLVSIIEARLGEWVAANPSILPTVDGREADDLARDVFIAYAASGAAGAFEVWLARGDLTDTHGIRARIYAAAASWWTEA